jgi:cardiolipin synthase
MHNWRETTVRVTGMVVEEMTFAFNEMWARTANKGIVSRINKARQYARGFHFVTNSPYFRKKFLYYSVIDALRGAHKYAYITTPYFVPDPRLIRVLKLAVKRGVDVRIIVPGHSVEPFVGLAGQSHYEHLLQYGIKIYIHENVFLHAKTIAIDDEWATVGSFNLDSLSFFYNYEANIVSTDDHFVSQVKSHFLVDQTGSKEITLKEWLKRPFIDKVREILIIPFRRFL